MEKINKFINDILSPWVFIFIGLIIGGHAAILTCLYLWHNALLYIFTPFAMLTLSYIISQNLNKKTSLISMLVVNIGIIISSLNYFVEMRESWEYLDEPGANEYFMSNMTYYCIAMFCFMLLVMRSVSRLVPICPKCGDWNTTEVLEQVFLGSYDTTMKLRNDKKVYDNIGRHIGSIENYDIVGVSKNYGYYKCKCTKCNHKWEERF